MKKLLLILSIAVTIISCSKECEYGGDTARVNELTEEIEQLEEKRDNASTDELAETYQKQIDRKQEELNDEMGKCV